MCARAFESQEFLRSGEDFIFSITCKCTYLILEYKAVDPNRVCFHFIELLPVCILEIF